MAGQNPSGMAFPTLNDFARNEVGIKGKVELIWQPLFDWNIYPTAGIATLPFFSTPIGQGQSSQPAAAAAAKNASDTNLQQAGMLPSPQAFWVDGLEVCVDPGGSATANLYTVAVPTIFLAVAAAASNVIANDFARISKSGLLTFSIMQKNYYQESPINRFPQRSAIRADAAYGDNSATTGSLSTTLPRAEGVGVRFDPGLGIATNTNFSVVMTWPALVTTTAPGSGFNARIGVFLNGWLFRAAQ